MPSHESRASTGRIHITAVDALALKLALQRMADQSLGYGITSVYLSQDDSHLMFTVERYAMDGLGHHVGHETFTAELKIFFGPELGIASCATPHSKTVVFPAAFDVHEIIPAQEEHVYTIGEAIDFLKNAQDYNENAKFERDNMSTDDIIQAAHDLGMSEGDYCPPDDDFAYQELYHHLYEAQANLPSGHFEPSTGVWSIRFPNGEIAHQYEPIRLPGVKYE